jgi:hypothetical protein
MQRIVRYALFCVFSLLSVSAPIAWALAKCDTPPDPATEPAAAEPAAIEPAAKGKAAPPSRMDRSLPTDPSAPPKTERQLAEERKKREAARKQGEITFDDLKFDIEKDGTFLPDMITPDIKELSKRTLKLRGFILPTSVFQQSGIKQFVLVRDNQECCFGPGAALYDCVIVEMAPGKTATFATRVVTVKGTFEIDPDSFQYPDGGHFAVFKMTAEEVK